MRKSLGIISAFGVAAISTIGIIQQRNAHGTSASRLETVYAAGVIQGWPIMIFVQESPSCTNIPNRLELHFNKGIRSILSYNRMHSAPSGYVLTFFKNAALNSGWTSAFPTENDSLAATNILMSSMQIPTKEMTNLPDGCNVSLGWLCYVPDGFWSSHSEPIQFSELSSLKGAWLYR